MNIHDLDRLEKDSIRGFLGNAAEGGYLSGDVLDFGCGQQPYRQLVEAAGGTYHGYDREQFGGNVSRRDVGPEPDVGGYDAILCTQVIQYVPAPTLLPLVARWSSLLRNGGCLVMTYPTTWPEIRDDLHRFTKLGMERLLSAGGFKVAWHYQRETIPFDGFNLPLGYGVIARRA